MVRLRCAGPICRRQGRNRSCVTVIGVIRHNNSAFARNRLGHAQGDIIGLGSRANHNHTGQWVIKLCG